MSWDVEVAHVERATRGLANDRKGFRNDLFEGLACCLRPRSSWVLPFRASSESALTSLSSALTRADRPAHAAQLALVSAPDDPLDYLVEHWRRIRLLVGLGMAPALRHR